jgi:hypothetical protein
MRPRDRAHFRFRDARPIGVRIVRFAAGTLEEALRGELRRLLIRH